MTNSQEKRLNYLKKYSKIEEVRDKEDTIQIFCIKDTGNYMYEYGKRGGLRSRSKYDKNWNLEFSTTYYWNRSVTTRP